MAVPEMSAGRSLGGLAALSAYRAERAEARLRLRAALWAERAALRAARAAPPGATEPAEAAAPAARGEEGAVFAELVARAGVPATAEEDALEEAAIEATLAAEAAMDEAAAEEVLAEERAADDEALPATEAMPAEPDDIAPPTQQNVTVMEPDVQDAPVVAVEPDHVALAPGDDTPAEPDDIAPLVQQRPTVVVPSVPDAPVVAAEPDPVALAPDDDTPAEPAEEMPADASAPQAADGAAQHRPLSAIGELGPGMQLRLTQLGIRTLDDLAEADPLALREGLGAISRLLHVERWIETARMLRASA